MKQEISDTENDTQSELAAWELLREARRQRDEWAAMCGRYKQERDEAREQAQQMSESNQVLLADVRFYRNAWEQLKEGAK